MNSSNSKSFNVYDYIIFVAFLCSSTIIGIYFAWKARHVKGTEDFFTGGRNLAVFPVVMSLVASFMSTNTLLGMPAEVFEIGTQYVMQIVSIVVAIVLAAEVFLPVYYKLGITSVNEYLELRYNSKIVRMFGSLAFLIVTMSYMSAVLYGPAIAFSSVNQISINNSIWIVGLIVTFYTTIGGIKAVIWTDVLQCILMFIGVAIVVVQGIIELGGFNQVINIAIEGKRLKLFNFEFDIYNHDNFWNVVAGTMVTWGAIYCISQTQVQRYLSMKSAKIAKKTLYYNLPGLILLAIMSIFSGLVIYGKYRNCDPVTLGIIERHDQLMPYYVLDTMSHVPGLTGFFVACIFSGSLSTLSSGFNALAAVTWEDYFKNNINISEKMSVHVVKLLAMFYGLLAIGFSFVMGRLGTVMQASMAISGSLSGPLFGLFFLGMFFRCVNAKGAMIGATFGQFVALFISFGSIIIPRPNVSMLTTINNCSTSITEQYIQNKTLHENKFITYYDNPEGISKFIHVSYLITSTTSFLSMAIVSIVFSLVTGSLKENENLDTSLVAPFANYLPPYKKENLNVELK